MSDTNNNATLSPQRPSPALALADGLASLNLQPNNSPSPVPPHSPRTHPSPLPFIMYTRSQLLFLHKSPLVQPPSGMPALKDWFGTESEQSNSKKDSETPLSAGNTRDRRFRREADDGSARPSFRGAAITQPSQMGNFKHQSIRTADRERDRDAEKEQDRERVKEGQERLRNLSDKYDRDRRALSSVSQMRAKDRELASHLANPPRTVAQGQQAISSRSSDSRDPQRKKDGESNEDWRRGADQPRTGRERTENGRRDRDDRDRPRSRARDSSRTRRESSPSRRDKEDRRLDRDEGHNSRRDRDDRDRDFERDSELEDPRRWRDDGKRDERVASRREREMRERERELRDRRDRPAWDASDRSDRRWAAGDDRDNRGKRPGGKDRKLGEDGKDRDDRKDREREKEPAWMDTYIPSSGSDGVIGAHRPGELDGIQAFKKEMQQKDKSNSPVSNLSTSQTQVSPPVQASESQLDEIQLFRLMMKREEEKKKFDLPAAPSATHTSTESISTTPIDDVPHGRAALEVGTTLAPTPTLSSESISHASSPGGLNEPSVIAGVTTIAPTLIAPTPSQPITVSLVLNGQEAEGVDKLASQSSRLFSSSSSSDPSATAKPDAATALNQASQAHPPGGSRLLALGSRNPQNAIVSPARSTSSQSPAPFIQKNGNVGVNAVFGVAGQSIEPSSHFTPATEPLRSNNGFSPFDDHRDASTLPNTSASEAIHRGPISLPADRTVFPVEHTEPGLGGVYQSNHSVQTFEPVGSNAASAKGSRFAKFFDGKNREGPILSVKATTSASGLSQPVPQKIDAPGLHPTPNSEARAMEDIFAMLNNSAQAQRVGAAQELASLDVEYGPPSNNLHNLQNAQANPHLLGPGRMDSLYDNRAFAPDGMVPGLRSVLPPRSRQGSAMFSDFSDEHVQFNNAQRTSAQYQGPAPPAHMQHGNMGRNGPISMQAAQFRGAPSPSHMGSVQRLPPGLANLGGRPPHEPHQFVIPSAGLTNGALHASGPPPFNNFQQPSLGFNGHQIRAPHLATHQLQGTLGPNTLQGLGHPGNLGSSQAQLLGLAGANGMHGGLRGLGGFGQQGPQVQPPHVALRQPQQSVPPHILPLHLQQQGFSGGATGQPAHDLMALLMNGARRE